MTENCNICNQCCASVHYKKSTPQKKVVGTKHRTSPQIQKVGGTCPPVYPWIYAHVDHHQKVQSMTIQRGTQSLYVKLSGLFHIRTCQRFAAQRPWIVRKCVARKVKARLPDCSVSLSRITRINRHTPRQWCGQIITII